VVYGTVWLFDNFHCKNTLLKIPIYIKNAKREREQNLQSNFKSSCPMSLVVMIYTFSRSMIVISIFFRCQDFQSAEKKSAKIKCLLFRPKPQKFHTAEITGYTVCENCQKAIQSHRPLFLLI
jgi:hypothetical protein